MRRFASSGLEKSSLISVLALCLSMSWLIPIHQIPWMSFHSDALVALILLLLAWLIVFKAGMSFKLDGLGLAAALCVINIWLQYAFGKVASFGIAWIYSLYLLGFLLAMLAGRAWQQMVPGQCGDFIFLSVLMAGLLSVVVQLCQVFGVGFSGGLVLPSNSTRYFANLGQPNQLGSLLVLAILACAWFYIKGSVDGAVAMGLVLVLALGLALTGSRTGWLNMAALAGGLLLYCKQSATATRLFFNFIWLLVFYILCVYFQPWVFIRDFFGYGLADMAVRPFSDQARVAIWKGLICSYNDYFLSGYGWGQISHSQTLYANPSLDLSNMIIQSHNLFLDVLLWVGFPFFLILFGLFLFWFFGVVSCLKKLSDEKVFLMFFFLVVLFVHSMLEFPLHYAYFLLPAGLMAGAISQSSNAMAIKIPRLVVVLILAMSTAGYFVTVKDYAVVEGGFLGLRFKLNGIQGVEEFPADSVMVLTHLRDYISFVESDPVSNHSEFDIGLGRDVVSSFPSALGMYKLAAMLALSGNSQEAEFWLDRICKINNRSQCELMGSHWAGLVKQNPSIAYIRFNP